MASSFPNYAESQLLLPKMAVWVKDLLTEQFTSAGWARLLGLTNEPRNLEAWLATVHSADQSRVSDALASALHGEVGEAGIQLEYRGASKDSAGLLLRVEILADQSDSRQLMVTGFDATTLRAGPDDGAGSSSERGQVLGQLHEISERERSFLASGIHDGLLQDIIGVEMLLHACDTLDRDQLKLRLARARGTLKSALQHGRKLIGELRPTLLDHGGLVKAIEVYAAELASRSSLDTRVVSHLEHDIAASVWCGNVFQIVQEALNNVEAHSETQHATVEVSQSRDQLVIVIADHGVGFDMQATFDSFGLRRMRDRAAAYQGTAHVESMPGQGTTVTIQIPLPSVTA